MNRPPVRETPAPTVVTGRLMHAIDSLTTPVPLADLFPVRQPVEVELGAGDGSFLVEQASRHPAHNFIGIERLMGRLRKIDRKGQRAGLANLRLIRIEAAYFVEYLVPPGVVNTFHVYFPDPWPKKRHHRRRLVNARFADAVARALRSGGCLHLRTDDAAYFAWMQEVFHGHPAFEVVETPPGLAALTTDFERDFNARGIATLRLSCRRRE